MFRKRRNVLANEEYKLVTSIEKARSDWMEIQAWRIYLQDDLDAVMPKMLAEVRYRYLLRQARKRNVINRWYLEIKESNHLGTGAN
jgi:hypothetical protein